MRAGVAADRIGSGRGRFLLVEFLVAGDLLKETTNDVIGINKDESVDFSEGDLSAEMMSELSK